MRERDYSDYYPTRSLNEEMSTSGNLAPFTFICVTVLLVLTGLMMLYSASYPEATMNGLPHYYYVLRQGIFALLGIICAVIINFIPLKWIRGCAIPLIVIAAICMLLTSFSPWGVTVMGARRWLSLPLIPQFQPSELVKFALIIFLSLWFSSQRAKNYRGWYYVVPIALILIFALMIVMQRAYTTAVHFLILCFVICLVGKLRLRYLIVVCAFLAVPALFLMLSESYRVKRVASFLFPQLDPQGMNWQVSRSLSAIAEGGFFGKGIGNGVYKLGQLPEVQNDFIFSSIIEETGFLGFSFILFLFALFAVLGYRAAARLSGRDTFSMIIAVGITTSILLQVVLNVAVITGLLPPTGIPVPFFSQGGTNLFIVIIECGLLYRMIRLSAGGGRGE